jgi:hypothetical protein
LFTAISARAGPEAGKAGEQRRHSFYGPPAKVRSRAKRANLLVLRLAAVWTSAALVGTVAGKYLF